MKLIIAGSRTFEPSIHFLKACIIDFHLIDVRQIVAGGANGVDASAKRLTEDKYDPSLLSIKLLHAYKEFPADWEAHGKAAGPIRNRQMAEYADSLLLIWDGESRGSASMKNEMLKLNKPVYEIIIKRFNV